MGIDPGSVGASTDARVSSWKDRETLLYALGVGAGLDELAFTTENSHDIPQQVLPTYGVIACGGLGALALIGDVNWGKLVHGSQSVQLHRPLPAAGEISVTSEVADIQDKGEGKNAIVTISATGVDTGSGEVVVKTSSTLVIRGAGGFGGSPGTAPAKVSYPDTAPDVSRAETTRADQALLYRLSGDRNPLHSDPWFATEKAGFPRPILHGLCTYGFAGRALLHELCDSDPARFGSMAARFSAPVFPGETLTTSAWRTGDTAVFRTEAAGPGGENQRVVLDDGVLTFAG
ncbi:MaoC family dehydratase [Pseudonocardia spinosispora]|uniref:MaoC family dehydratase n=1 Tax=Pseudonocardia spinosispora TaxID=103441 RepID=UPI000422AF0C|nr:MaoC family dehydratase [Pseudonocardia spinosispora]